MEMFIRPKPLSLLQIFCAHIHALLLSYFQKSYGSRWSFTCHGYDSLSLGLVHVLLVVSEEYDFKGRVLRGVRQLQVFLVPASGIPDGAIVPVIWRLSRLTLNIGIPNQKILLQL